MSVQSDALGSAAAGAGSDSETAADASAPAAAAARQSPRRAGRPRPRPRRPGPYDRPDPLTCSVCQGKFFSEASLAGEQAARDASLHPYEQHDWPFVRGIQCNDVSCGVA